MRNPTRTTKRERRFIRRYNPYAARILGVAEAARWYREGVLLDEARGFDNILNDLKYGIVPLDLNDRVNAAIDGQRDRLERILGTIPGALKSTSSNVNHHGGTHTGYEVSDGPNPHITLKYPPHVSLGNVPDVHQLEPGEWQATVDATRRAPASLTLPESLGGGTFEVEHDSAEAEPLGPSECGYYEVVDIRPNLNAIAVPDAWFAKYEAYRKGREAGDKMVWHEDEPMYEFPVDAPFAPIDPSLMLGEYQAYSAGHDPNEVAAVHAEAIENALNDDIDPGE